MFGVGRLGTVLSVRHKGNVGQDVHITNALGCSRQEGCHESCRGVDMEASLLKKIHLAGAVNEGIVFKGVAVCLFALVLSVGAEAVRGEVGTVRIASGLDRPVFATAPPGDVSRLFIPEQHTGKIKILDLADGTINAAPFLVIPGLAMGNEQGLLGLTFDPDYASNGLFYVNFTPASGGTRIMSYQVSGDPDIADAGSATTVLTYPQPQSNHNGGWLGFGPDGYLYIGSGDGGRGYDSGTGHTAGTGNSQDITDNLLGKILRIDVGRDDFPGDSNRNYGIPPTNPFVGVTGDDEIWAYGLRNPWRASFDRATGDLYIGDVGQSAREEIDFQSADSEGGGNYGWRLREGTIETPHAVGGEAPAGAVDPIYDYAHGSGPDEGWSVTGGYVYRGPVVELRGLYIFADYGTNNIWSFRYDGATLTEFTHRRDQFVPDAGSISGISSFGEDEVGNLYIVDLDGEIFKIVGDLLPGDANGNGFVDDTDLAILLSNWEQGPLIVSTWELGNFTEATLGDTDVNDSDLSVLLGNWTGPPPPAGAAVPEPATLALLALGALGVLRRRSAQVMRRRRR